MNVLRDSPAPRSLVRLADRTFATYDTVVFLDPRAADLGGRIAPSRTQEPVDARRGRLFAIGAAVTAVLATVSLFVLLALRMRYP